MLLSYISQSVSQLENPGKACIYCHKGFTEGDTLIHVGSRYRDDQNKQHPIKTLIIYAEKLKKEDLGSLLKDNKERKVHTYIHLSCRNSLKISPTQNERLKMNIQQQVKELAKDPKLRSLILLYNVFIVEKYIALTVNILTVIISKELLQKILAFIM